MRTSIIAALSRNEVIGKDGKLPWHLPADLKRFKQLTMGHTVVMGRKTFESIGKPLPGRINIVVSHNFDVAATECLSARSMEDVLRIVPREEKEVFFIGGESIFREALCFAEMMYLTRVECTCDGDTFFPQWNKDEWEEIACEFFPRDEKNAYDLTFHTYRRRHT